MFTTNKQSILIIDDDLSILHAFSRIFQRKGYTVTVAAKGSEAIQVLNHGSFDVALIDYRLPDMEGTELLPLIQNSSPTTVRIMLTGKMIQETVVGADALVGKPINPDKLLSIIESKLRNRNMESL